jgi:HTH-type transcriptional regulator/antitoxin HigA
METLKYKVIKTKKQYNEYCNKLENLSFKSDKRTSKTLEDEMDLLTLLIEKYDEEHTTFKDVDPIRLLKSFMTEHKLLAADLAKLLNVSKGLVSDMLNYKKGLSKEIIRKLAEYFKVRQELFNRPYKLVSPLNAHLKNASVMNTQKNLVG